MERTRIYVRNPAEALLSIKDPLASLDAHLKNSVGLTRDARLNFRHAITRIEYLVRSVDSFSLRSLVPHQLKTLLIEILREKQVVSRHRQKLSLFLDPSVNNLQIFWNPEEIKCAMSLLLENAVEASRPSDTIRIEARIHRGQIEIAVVDNGKGIDQKNLPHIFSKGRSFGKCGAQGLGLYHCQKIINRMDGSLTIRSQVGFGTIATISWPLKPTAPWETEVEMKAWQSTPTCSISGRTSERPCFVS